MMKVELHCAYCHRLIGESQAKDPLHVERIACPFCGAEYNLACGSRGASAICVREAQTNPTEQ